MSVNDCKFIGNITRQPELKYLPNGTPVCEFGIACNEKYKDKDGVAQEAVEFINIVAWRGLAEVCGKHLEKGKQVYISGKFKTKNWEKDGVKFYRTEIHAEQMQMLGSKSDNQPNNQSSQGSWGANNNQNQGHQNNNQSQSPAQHPQGCQCPDCVQIPF